MKMKSLKNELKILNLRLIMWLSKKPQLNASKCINCGPILKLLICLVLPF
jgi:hypothetical protein